MDVVKVFNVVMWLLCLVLFFVVGFLLLIEDKVFEFYIWCFFLEDDINFVVWDGINFYINLENC